VSSFGIAFILGDNGENVKLTKMNGKASKMKKDHTQ
jgi:hypothetical protein